MSRTVRNLAPKPAFEPSKSRQSTSLLPCLRKIVSLVTDTSCTLSVWDRRRKEVHLGPSHQAYNGQGESSQC